MDKLKAILQDPSTPYWVIKLISECRERDIVDVATALAVVSDAWTEHCNEVLGCSKLHEDSNPLLSLLAEQAPLS